MKNSIKHCDFCGKDATCLCFECLNYFCDNCYKLIHDLQNNSSHKKEEIDLYVPIDIKCPYHPKNPLNLFCVDEKGKKNILLILFIELCCAYCLYKNLHQNHKILEISDIESLKKENITIESSSKEFNEIINQTTNLKNKIEQEIDKINNYYFSNFSPFIN